ncbi:unnamed protein product [Discula destructiva]
MVSYTFRWAHPAEEVYVTGTFDNWSKSEKMAKVGDVFEKSVELPDTSEKIYYKFVVDGTWTTNTTDPKEKDEGGNENNVLTPEALLASLPATSAIMSNVTADSTTAQLAKDVPLEKDNKEQKPDQLPGSFPETPAANELNNPIGISPLPAAAGALNPIKLAPGEPVPKDLQTADLNSNVKLDAESYEKADALPGINTSDLNIPLVGGVMIPESSLPMGNGTANINSVGTNATTAALAAQVPKEPKVPDVVKESQDKAGVDPEASGIATEVEDKNQVEEELKDKVPEAPSTSEGTGGKGTDKSEGDKTLLETAAAATAALGAGAAAYAYAAKDKAVELAGQAPASVQEQLPASVQDTIATGTKETKIEEVSPEVPTEVKDSIVEAGKSPEAAANTEAVGEKAAVEAELLKEVKTVNTTGEPAPKPEEPQVPATTTQEAPKVVEPPAESKDIPETSTPPSGLNGTAATTENGAGNGAGPAAPTTPAESSKTDPETPNSSKSDQKKKNRVSGFFGKLKSKISHKDGN